MTASNPGMPPIHADAHLSLLRVDDVQVAHGPALHTLSLTLQAGECVCLQGPSGSGKTRLLRLLADLDEGPGDVYLRGVHRREIAAPLWRRQVVYHSAEPGWWETSLRAHFSVAQLPLVQDLMQRLALAADRLDLEIAQLSTGERQRAALIRSLSVDPQVLLLDEPTSALDQANVERVEALLRERLRAGMAILLVTHAEAQSQRLAQRRIMIGDSGCVAVSPV